MVWLETPTERTLLLGSLVMAIDGESVSPYNCHGIHPMGLLTLPGVDDGDTVINNHITTVDGAVSNKGEVVIALLESDGPVDKVELTLLVVTQSDWNKNTYIEVFHFELSETGIQSGLDDLGTVLAACS